VLSSKVIIINQMFSCTIVGLVSHSHLNGKNASVLSYEHSRARYKVLVDGTAEPLLIKPENIFASAEDASVTSRQAIVQKHAQMMAILEEAEASGNREYEVAACIEVGTILKNMEHFQDAISYQRRAIKVAQEIQTTSSSTDERQAQRANEGVATSNLGICLRRLGELDSAVAAFKRAIEIGEETGHLLHQGSAMGNLGVAYNQLGERDNDYSKHELAIEILTRGLAISREVGSQGLEKNILGNLAQAHSHLETAALRRRPTAEQYAGWQQSTGGQALEYEMQSLALKKKSGDRRGEANSLFGLGSMLYNKGAYAEAKQRFQESIAISKDLGQTQLLGKASYMLGSCEMEAAKALATDTKAGQQLEVNLALERAVVILEDAVKQLDAVWRTLSDDNARITYADEMFVRNDAARLLQSAYYQLFRFEEALLTAEAASSASLEALLAHQRGGAAAPVSPVSECVDIENIRQCAIRQRVCIVFYSTLGNEISDLGRTRAGLMVWVMSSSGELASCCKLHVDGSVAELVELTRRALGVQPRQSHQARSDEALLDEARLKRQIEMVDWSDDEETGPSDGRSLRQLLGHCHKQIIEPIAAAIADEPHLMIVPDRDLFSLPFATLLAPNGRYLIENHTLRIAPSIGVILELERRCAGASPPSQKALVVGITEFAGWAPPLDQAAVEAKAVAAVVPGASLMLNCMATKSAVMAGMEEADYIHLATHGVPNGVYLYASQKTEGLMSMADVQACRLCLITIHGNLLSTQLTPTPPCTGPPPPPRSACCAQ